MAVFPGGSIQGHVNPLLKKTNLPRDNTNSCQLLLLALIMMYRSAIFFTSFTCGTVGSLLGPNIFYALHECLRFLFELFSLAPQHIQQFIADLNFLKLKFSQHPSIHTKILHYIPLHHFII